MIRGGGRQQCWRVNKKRLPWKGVRGWTPNPRRRDWPLRGQDKHIEERRAEEESAGQTGGSLMVGRGGAPVWYSFWFLSIFSRVRGEVISWQWRWSRKLKGRKASHFREEKQIFLKKNTIGSSSTVKYPAEVCYHNSGQWFPPILFREKIFFPFSRRSLFTCHKMCPCSGANTKSLQKRLQN